MVDFDCMQRLVRSTKHLHVQCVVFFYIFSFQIDDPTFKVDLSAPKIMFTKFDSDQFDRDIIQLGGIIEQSPEAASVLVSENVRRTCKFMCAMIRGIPIVTPEWIRQSIKAKKFIAVDHYIVRDMAAEKKFSFNMVVSLSEYTIHYFQNVCSSIE